MEKIAPLSDRVRRCPMSVDLVESDVDRFTSLLAALVYYSASSNCDKLVYQRVFASWLALPLEQQFAELKQFLICQTEPNRLLQSWAKGRWYESLVPNGARLPDKLLFICDFEIILALASADLDLARARD